MDKKKPRSGVTVVGGASLLVIFTVLCLTVFALLSLATAQADAKLADSSAQAVLDYYAADLKAEELFASLRSGSPADGSVELTASIYDYPDGPKTVYTYAVPISDTQELQVELEERDGKWTVNRWQAVSTADWTPDDSLPVWDGELD